jgi:hypothetical protein
MPGDGWTGRISLAGQPGEELVYIQYYHARSRCIRSDILCNGGCRAVVYSTVAKLHANLCYLVDQLSFFFYIYLLQGKGSFLVVFGLP